MATTSPARIEGRSTTTIEDLHPDLLTRALRHVDGPTLASASCATSHLRSLSSDPDTWRDLCLSTWPSLRLPPLADVIPSFPNSHRSFFSDAYPFPFLRPERTRVSTAKPLRELISAVDLYHNGSPVFSRVVRTETLTPWFLGSPFRIDALDRKHQPPPHPSETKISPGDLTLSWILIDPIGRRAVNLSSRKPVAVDRHWYTGEIQARFAMVLGETWSVGVVVTCGEETGQVREVSLVMENVDGMCLNGRESLVVLEAAMEGGRRGRGRGEEEEEAKKSYVEFVKRKKERKERKLRRDGRLDTCCIAVGVSVFFAFLVLLFKTLFI